MVQRKQEPKQQAKPAAQKHADNQTAKATARPSATPTVLLTGFDAFGGESINPSWLAVLALKGRQVAGHRVVVAQLPTVFDEANAVLRQAVTRCSPRLVICVGQAGGRAALSVERIAINVNDARIADNKQAQPIDTPVVAGGPAAYFSGLPIKVMVSDLLKAGIAAEVSQTAGTFVCNHVFYGLMHFLATQRGLKESSFTATRGGFVHVPYATGQGNPSMALLDMTRGLQIAVRSALENIQDVQIGAGAIH